MKHPPQVEMPAPRPEEDLCDLEQAFDLLLVGEGPGQPERSVSDLRAESIALHRCTYCDQPATVSQLALDGRNRTLLCGVCRPPRG